MRRNQIYQNFCLLIISIGIAVIGFSYYVHPSERHHKKTFFLHSKVVETKDQTEDGAVNDIKITTKTAKIVANKPVDDIDEIPPTTTTSSSTTKTTTTTAAIKTTTNAAAKKPGDDADDSSSSSSSSSSPSSSSPSSSTATTSTTSSTSTTTTNTITNKPEDDVNVVDTLTNSSEALTVQKSNAMTQKEDDLSKSKLDQKSKKHHTAETLHNRGTVLNGKDKKHRYMNRQQAERLLRDSIDSHHLKNFVKPENEKCKRRFPTCIVIGVAKCGSREIMDFMRLHPHIDIYWQNHSYENPYFANKYYKGEQWFKSQMPCTYSNQITVIKNAWYFHSDPIPKRIHSFNKNVKLIILVREPVSRAISQYMFFHPRAALGHQRFDDVAITGDSVNTKADCIRRSIYDEPMKKWLQYYNLDQFLIIDSNELKSDPAKVMYKVEDFLGLEHYVTPEMFVWNKKKGFYCIQSDLTGDGMACYAQDRGRKQTGVEPTTIVKLKKYFKRKNERFFNMTGRSFDWD